MRIVPIEQGTSTWGAWRGKGIGSSDSAILWWGQHFEDGIYDLWTDKMGKGSQKVENSAMKRGKRLEPLAREIYAELTGLSAEPVCALHDTFDFLKASLDGWDAAEGIIQEIKCPNKYDHADALDGKVPQKYVPQLFHQFIVSSGKCKSVHYISYNDKSFKTSEQFAIVSLSASWFHPVVVEAFLAKELQFWKYVEKRYPPRDEFLPLCQELDLDALLPS